MIAWLALHLALGLLTGWGMCALAAQVDVHLRGDVDRTGPPAKDVSLDVANWPWPPDIAELVTEHGYPLEKHWVETDDGYMLQIFRISQYSSSCCPPTVFLQHGLLVLADVPALQDSAAAWILNLPHQSLAFMLHDAGYDVWLGNVRGSTWGLQHGRLDPSDDTFWQFTYDDMASKDIPAMIQHILAATCAPSISYVGHSQGTMIALEALATAASASAAGEATPLAKVDVAVLLAPVAFPRHTTSLLLRTLADLDAPRAVARFGVTSFLPSGVGSVFVFSQMCRAAPSFCVDILQQICGVSTALNETRLPLYLKYVPAGTSVMNMEHWGQAVREHGRLTLWGMDFGSDCEHGPWPGACNQRRYATGRPPEFHLHNIRVPLALLSGAIPSEQQDVFWAAGDKDVLAPPTDVELLREVLPKSTVVFSKEYRGYSHLDFTLGIRAHIDVYPDVLRVLAEHAHHPGTCMSR